MSVEVPIALRRQDRTYLRVRTARLGLEGCESFVDDLIGCRVLYSVRDALLHRSLEIQPWHFPIRYFFLIFFFKVNRCWVAAERLRKNQIFVFFCTGHLVVAETATGGSSVVEQWTVKRSSQLSIGREFKSPSPEVLKIFRKKV